MWVYVWAGDNHALDLWNARYNAEALCLQIAYTIGIVEGHLDMLVGPGVVARHFLGRVYPDIVHECSQRLKQATNPSMHIVFMVAGELH